MVAPVTKTPAISAGKPSNWPKRLSASRSMSGATEWAALLRLRS
jgi:hypothetical protein